LLSQGLFDEAEAVMSNVPPVVPASSSIYLALGDQYGRRGEYGRAIANFSRAAQVDPTNHFAFSRSNTWVRCTWSPGRQMPIARIARQCFASSGRPLTRLRPNAWLKIA
jgi:hypothetical protein